MHFSAINIDKSATEFSVWRSEKFRTPSEEEKALELWVDRIGADSRTSNEFTGKKLRILGLYAAIYVKSGSGIYFNKRGYSYNVKKGNVIIVFPEEPHFYTPSPFWESIWVVWSGSEAKKLENLAYLDRKKYIFPDRFAAVLNAYGELIKYMDNNDKEAFIKRKSILLTMIHGLFEGHRNFESDVSRRIYKSADLISSSTEPQSISEIATATGFSQTHFRRLFKEKFGVSPKKIMISTKISKAKELLASGLTIKETAERIGFKDQFYFMRVFKKITGMSAGKFRSK
ncbi:MAG TPA: AraC family transcriptional regulator [Victivallales bacterium]|nr:AraC family transcriptional regulator [Victivallales bacterium]HRR28948.1 AraC family transcriptional regulator [Victivallales bacterium]HRU02197.1 AraC family transcriptional regulator [Victivallales bacterium]